MIDTSSMMKQKGRRPSMEQQSLDMDIFANIYYQKVGSYNVSVCTQGR